MGRLLCWISLGRGEPGVVRVLDARRQWGEHGAAQGTSLAEGGGPPGGRLHPLRPSASVGMGFLLNKGYWAIGKQNTIGADGRAGDRPGNTFQGCRVWGLCSAGEGRTPPPGKGYPCIISRCRELEALMMSLLSLGQRRAPVRAQTPWLRSTGGVRAIPAHRVTVESAGGAGRPVARCLERPKCFRSPRSVGSESSRRNLRDQHPVRISHTQSCSFCVFTSSNGALAASLGSLEEGEEAGVVQGLARMGARVGGRL